MVDHNTRKRLGGNVADAHLSFARNCLLARRMVERGVRFINVIYEAWDQHSDLEQDLRYNSWVVDQPIAAAAQGSEAAWAFGQHIGGVGR
ncbi:MAG: DUF1501 domain-containing protein [Pirellulaceae bacterium]